RRDTVGLVRGGSAVFHKAREDSVEPGGRTSRQGHACCNSYRKCSQTKAAFRGHDTPLKIQARANQFQGKLTPDSCQPRRLDTSDVQWKLSPQAHLPAALGLSIVNPCSEIVSLKSIAAPSRYGTLMLSTMTSTPSKSTVSSPSR